MLDSSDSSYTVPLLIVLNGIEICSHGQSEDWFRSFNRTKWNWNILNLLKSEPTTRLLIVLNGIEMFENSVAGFGGSLLIVLNGIEISDDWFQPTFGQTFNRTKWNWNLLLTACSPIFANF